MIDGSFAYCVNYTDTHPDSEGAIAHPAICKAPKTKARRKKVIRGSVAAANSVKNERCSPDPEIGTESSRSDSPHSPSSSCFRTRTPQSLAGTPPNPPFTPPERFSPGSYGSNPSGKSAMEGLHMSRNYSDFMRSLAAKYNNANPNEFRTANGFLPALDRFTSFKATPSNASASPFALLNLPLGPLTPAVAAAAAAAAAASKKELDGSKKDKREQVSPPHPLSLPNLMAGLNPVGLSPFPMIDMSSTQALLNIVRSASAQNAQQLDTYLRNNAAASGAGAATPTKRPAETAPLSHTPLDLSAPVAKRPHLEHHQSAAYHFGHIRTSAYGAEALKDSRFKDSGKKSPPAQRMAPPVAISPRVSSDKTPKTPASASASASWQLPMSCRLACAADACSPAAVKVQSWAVSDVVDFIKSIDLCHEYAEVSPLSPNLTLP